MPNSKSNFSYKITVDHEKRITLVNSFINEKKAKVPIYMAQNTMPYTIAEACRATAFQLLERADGIQHNNEFCYSTDIQKQIELMKYENRSVFETHEDKKENHPSIKVWKFYVDTYNDDCLQGIVKDVSEDNAKSQLVNHFNGFEEVIKNVELHLLQSLTGEDVGIITI